MTLTTIVLNNLSTALNILGTIAFAISGTLSAQYKKMDLFGIIVIANITAIGGGTLRDVLINNHPIVWIKDPSCLFIGTAAAIITLFINRSSKHFLNILLIMDAIGLAVFVIAGIQLSLDCHVTPFIASIMGVLTGIGGGMLRDILCGEVPLVLQKDIYATAAIFGAIVYFTSFNFFGETAAISAGIISTLGLRLCAIYKGWSLPRVGK